MKNKKRIITEKEQRVAANILIQFAFCNNMEEHNKIWKEIFAEYGLFTDPFTKLPESAGQHSKSSYEYDKQTFENKYDVPYEDFMGGGR